MDDNQLDANPETPQDDSLSQEGAEAPVAAEESAPVAASAPTEPSEAASNGGGGGRALMIVAVIAIVLAVVALFMVLRDRNSGATPEPEPTAALPGAPQPVIVFPPEARVGDNVTFDGSQSQPGDNPIAGYRWSFGDGATAEGQIALYAYKNPGKYNVTLTVVDNTGLGTIGGPVEVSILPVTAPALPQPVIVAPASAQIGQQVSFDGSQSQPGDNPIASYTWDFGDGNSAAGAVVAYAYSTPGQFGVTLTVTDQAGFGNVAGPVQITIAPAAVQPTVGVAPQPIMIVPEAATVGTVVTFDGSQSTPGSSPITNYTWTFGDGSSATGQVVTYSYQQPGLYPVSLTVTAEDGLTTPSGAVEINITSSDRDD